MSQSKGGYTTLSPSRAMPASRHTKLIVRGIVFLLAICVAWFAYGFLNAWHRFSSEERICGAFHPVINGIYSFQEKTGVLPTNLIQLVPAYIDRIPDTTIAQSIDYHLMPDGTNWHLAVRSHITGATRVYIQRSTGEFTPEERQKAVTAFHGWVVFRDEK